jgi:hypothetical protein
MPEDREAHIVGGAIVNYLVLRQNAEAAGRLLTKTRAEGDPGRTEAVAEKTRSAGREFLDAELALLRVVVKARPDLRMVINDLRDVGFFANAMELEEFDFYPEHLTEDSRRKMVWADVGGELNYGRKGALNQTNMGDKISW